MVDHKTAFSVHIIPDEKVPLSLRRCSFAVAKQVSTLSGKKTLMQRLVVDFEACVDISDFDQSTPVGVKASRIAAATVPHNDASVQGEACSKRYLFRYF